MKPLERLGFVCVALTLTLGFVALAQGGAVSHQSFKAFYCAAYVANHRGDPYLTAPLQACERRAVPTLTVVEPAPIPGYAVATFEPLTFLSLRAAALCYVLVLALVTIVSAWSLSQLLGISATGTLLTFTPLATLNAAYGETPPLALVALCAAGYCLKTSRWRLAGIAIGCSLIQPNIAAPVVVSALLWLPRTRGALLATLALLGVVSIATVGIGENLEYLRTVLPLQARAEVAAADQYGLAHLLFLAGVSVAKSLVVAQMVAVVAAALGIALGGLIARRTGWMDSVVLIPPAVTLCFGLYAHDIQMLLCLPAALAFAVRLPGKARAAGTLALVLLATVWTQGSPLWWILDALGATAATCTVARGESGQRLSRALASAVVVLLAVIAIAYGERLRTHAERTTTSTVYAAEASEAWGQYIDASPFMTRRLIADKLPTFVGLLAILAIAGRIATRARYESRERLPATES